MPVNRKNIEAIKEAIRKHVDRYNQDSFGQVNECGTTMCIAGFCRVKEVGLRQFKKEVACNSPQRDLQGFVCKLRQHNSRDQRKNRLVASDFPERSRVAGRPPL